LFVEIVHQFATEVEKKELPQLRGRLVAKDVLLKLMV
jgi:hypothetical protein